MNLASHLLRDAHGKRFEVAVIVTNDSDLAEPVRIVAQELGLPVGLLSPHQFHGRELRQYATFIKRIRQGDLAACQFPKTLTDRKGTLAKPSGWYRRVNDVQTKAPDTAWAEVYRAEVVGSIRPH